MALPITQIFRRVNPDAIAADQLRSARIDLLTAEQNLENAQAHVSALRSRIARLSQVTAPRAIITGAIASAPAAPAAYAAATTPVVYAATNTTTTAVD